MDSKKFKIYSSSAGSGKTYTLTKEYLKLALQSDDPHYFRHILAITFTNDAANEMKSRIVNSLRGFSFPALISPKEQARSKALLQEISAELKIHVETLAQRAQSIFHKIIYNYTDFAVSTIDSFVNKIVNAFTRELEIPYNFEVDLDTDALLQNAVDRVLAKVGQESKAQLSSFVIDWVNQKTEEGKNWSRIANDLVSFATDLMNESAYPFLKLLEELEIDDFQRLHHQIGIYQKQTEGQVIEIAKKGSQLIQSRGLSDKDFHYGAKGVPGYFKQNQDSDKLDMGKGPNSYVMAAIEDDKWSKNLNAIIEEIKGQLAEYIHQIEELKTSKGGVSIFLEQLKPQLYKLALIKEIEIELKEVKRENNTIHISDSNKKISEIIRREPVPYIYERVGEKYNHILIDEFQDTSVLQWQNLLPLIENNLSEGYFNLIVGDAKQAIYRWRGGEMEQLVYLYKNRIQEIIDLGGENSPFLAERYEVLRQNHLPAHLNFNFRSYQEIIRFNNDFFETLLKAGFSAQFPLFPEIYDENFAQNIPPQNTKEGGHVEIEFMGEDKNLYEGQTLERIRKLIEQLLTEGFQWKDIAILTRNNSRGKLVANFLKKNGIDVLSQTSLLLVSDEKVRFLVALLKVIHKPEDRLAKSEALYLFYKVVKNETPTPIINQKISEIVSDSILAFYGKFADEGCALNYARLQAMDLYELVEKMIEVFKLMQGQARLEYLFRFLDVILQFRLQTNTTLETFLEYWEEKKEVLSINTPKDLNAVNVTTIHKSKGLEFPVVILPFADWSLEPNAQSTLWVNVPEEVSSIFELPKGRQLKSALIGIKKALAGTPIEPQYNGELQKSFLENTNMLYVALTRPVHRLYIISKMQEFERESSQKYVSYLLYLYLLSKNVWDKEQHQYILQEGKPLQDAELESEADYFYIEDFVSTGIHRKIRRKNSEKS